MKKLFISITLAAFVSLAAFADCDFQIFIGGHFDNITADFEHYTLDEDYDSCVIGISNHNTWTIKKTFVSIGFMDSLYCLVGSDILGVNALIAPTVGLRAGKVCKFQISPGIFFGAVHLAEWYGSDFYTQVGFALDIQARFLSNSPVSPVIGYKYQFTNPHSDDFDDDTLKQNSNQVYFAISFNFGNRKAQSKQKTSNTQNAQNTARSSTTTQNSNNSATQNDNSQSSKGSSNTASLVGTSPIYGGPLPRGSGAIRQ